MSSISGGSNAVGSGKKGVFFFAPVDVREVTLGGVRFQHEVAAQSPVPVQYAASSQQPAAQAYRAI